LVSAVVPVYNGEKYLVEALGSIRHQDYEPLEVVVVDDGSTDGTEEIVRGFDLNLRYSRQQNGGPSAARNRGLELARGEIIAFQDADDLWPEGKLALQLPKLVNDPSLGIVSGRVQRIKLAGSAGGKEVFENFLEPCISYNLGAALFRRSVFDRVGPFDVTMRYSEDVEWLMRAREHGVKMLILKQVSLLYRLHGQNMTHGLDVQGIRFMEALKKSADRRRRAGGPISRLPLFTDFDERAE
jgi:glycosyltransferase involved in cell wall biosynthesis